MGGRKRDRREYERREEGPNQFGMGQTLSILRGADTAEDLPDGRRDSSPEHDPSKGDWQTVEKRANKKQKRNSKNDLDDAHHYPSIKHSSHARLQTHVKISDFQSLVLYLLADGPAPQWVSVSHHGGVKKVVVLMVPGLEAGMFDGKIPLETSSTVPDNTTLTDKQDGSGHAAKTAEEAPTDRSSDSTAKKVSLSPDDYYPVELVLNRLPEPLRPLAVVFPHVWPVKTPGDDKYSRIHSPLHAMLTAPFPKTKEEKKMKGAHPPKEDKNWQNKRTPITEYLATYEQLLESEYVIHPAMCATAAEKDELLQRRRLAKQTCEYGWVDTAVDNLEDGTVPDADVPKGSLTAGRNIIAMDCEMCKTAGDVFELTRISLTGWDGFVIMDELVKPETPIQDYLTPYSGITKDMLDPVTTTLADIQVRLLQLITPHTILLGHSLNSDLLALKLTHPFIVDTSILYPHPRGPPLKSSLKWLAQKYLSREIQKNHGTTGHNSIEDARSCLDLVKLKCEKGPTWGTSDATGEPIFKRLARSRRPKQSTINGAAYEVRTGAVVDWGDPRRGPGSCAEVCIGCTNDAEVVEGVRMAVNGDPSNETVPAGGVDFVWARLRELEAIRGWWNRSKTADNAELRTNIMANLGGSTVNGSKTEDPAALGEAVARTVKHIMDIYAALPPCTAFMVYSGTGDPREVARLQAMQQQFKKEYQTKKWDELSVQWTDVENQALQKACRKARMGVGFVVVK